MSSPVVAMDMLNAGNISPSFCAASSTHLDIQVNDIVAIRMEIKINSHLPLVSAVIWTIHIFQSCIILVESFPKSCVDGFLGIIISISIRCIGVALNMRMLMGPWSRLRE